MKFVKLHQNGREVLVNLCTISEIYPTLERGKSTLYFNFRVGEGEQLYFTVDESLDEILHLIEQTKE